MTPQDAVERALAAARSDETVAIADESSSANLRWAGNTLTTNGVSRSRQLTVIAISKRADGTSAGLTLHTIDGTIPQLRRSLDRSLDAFFDLLPGADEEDVEKFGD